MNTRTRLSRSHLPVDLGGEGHLLVVMRILATFLIAVAMAGSGCSHHKSTPAAPAAAGHFSTVPGMETTPAAAAPAASTAGPKVIPFGAPAEPAASPTQNSAAPTPAVPPPADSTPTPPAGGKQKLIVTPEQGYVGKIATVNDVARFVIVTFPIGHVPPLGQSLNVYRNGLKVGEVKVTEPQRDEFTAADIVAGDSAVGDEVRDR